MKILITGGTGFLGRHLSRFLQNQSQKHELTELNSRNCDLTRSDTLSKYSKIKFDRIFHLATWTQAGDFCLKHPAEQWEMNQLIHSHLLAWWNRHQPSAKLITLGSSCGYPTDKELTESNFLKGSPYPPSTPME